MQLFPDCAWPFINAYDLPFAGFQRGEAGLAHAILGSFAESLLGNPPCDVLVAHATS